MSIGDNMGEDDPDKIKGFDRLLCIIKGNYDTFLKPFMNKAEPISVDDLCDIASDVIEYHLTYS